MKKLTKMKNTPNSEQKYKSAMLRKSATANLQAKSNHLFSSENTFKQSNVDLISKLDKENPFSGVPEHGLPNLSTKAKPGDVGM